MFLTNLLISKYAYQSVEAKDARPLHKRLLVISHRQLFALGECAFDGFAPI